METYDKLESTEACLERQVDIGHPSQDSGNLAQRVNVAWRRLRMLRAITVTFP